MTARPLRPGPGEGGILRRATEYVVVLYKGLAGWAGVDADHKRKLHDTSNRTEMFRRIPAFLELAEQLVVGPLKMRGGSRRPA